MHRSRKEQLASTYWLWTSFYSSCKMCNGNCFTPSKQRFVVYSALSCCFGRLMHFLTPLCDELSKSFEFSIVHYAEGLWLMHRCGPAIAHYTDSEDFAWLAFFKFYLTYTLHSVKCVSHFWLYGTSVWFTVWPLWPWQDYCIRPPPNQG